MTPGTYGVQVKCVKAALGYERLEGQIGILSGVPLPSMDFFFAAGSYSVTIKNATEWEFENAPITDPSPAGAVDSDWTAAQTRLRALIGSKQRIVRSPWSDCVGQETVIKEAYANLFVSFEVRHDGDVRCCGIGESNWKEWEFEQVPPAAGYVQAKDLFLWGQRVRCVAAPQGVAIGREGTLQPPTGEGSVAVFCSARDWHVGHTGWVFDKVEVANSKATDAPVATTDGKPFDDVNHPKHYNVHPSSVECIEIMERLGANLGSAFKYLWRADDKHETPLVDLKKALWYLRREKTTEWEKSTATEERLWRVVPYESFAIGSAMVAIFDAAGSENYSTEKRRAIDRAVDFIEMELRKLDARSVSTALRKETVEK